MNFVLASFISLIILLSLLYIKLYRLGLRNATKKIEKLTVAIMVTIIFFFSTYFSFVEFSYLEKSRTDNQDIIWLSIVLVGIVWLFSHAYKDKDPSKDLRSEKGESLISPPTFKKISDIKNEKITTYPRITIENLRSNENKSELIFDSSDFEVINKMVGTTRGLQPSFCVGEIIEVDNVVYKIESVRIDFLNLFDDYSLQGHSKIYSGLNTPYNIQIIVGVNKLSISH